MVSSTSRETEALHPPPALRRWTVVSPAQLPGLRAQLRYLASLWAVTEDCADRILMIVNELVSPRIPPHDVNAARGRGLQMIRALSSHWGWTARHGGKTVWAVVHCSEA